MTTPSPPTLDSRFLEPPGFRWSSFTREGRTIRFGYALPGQCKPEAIVVILPGLSEFVEKYFETMRELLERGMAVACLDWMGQGKSSRYFPKRPHKRHCAGFEEDLKDLHELLEKQLKPTLRKHEGMQDLPYVMLGHSMGGNLGLRYLAQYPDTFICAGFSAPMLGIAGIGKKLFTLAEILNAAAGEAYAFGQRNWTHTLRARAGEDQFSSDPVRGAIHNAWCLTDPALQVGGVTFRWVHDALLSCAALEERLSAIRTPCLIALAGRDKIVDNNAIQRAIRVMPDAVLMELLAARHEILMERDEIRSLFLKSFYALVKTHMINGPETIQTTSRG